MKGRKMKKFILILIIFLLAANLQANDNFVFDAHEDDHSQFNKGTIIPVNNTSLFFALEDTEQDHAPEEKKSFFKRNRTFEFGIANLNLGFANNLLSLTDIFQETLVIDLNQLNRGFHLGFDVNVRPLFFNINIKDRWGFGLDIANVTAYGNINIHRDLLQIRESENALFGAGAAAFVEVGIPAFFTIRNIWHRNLKIRVRPAGYVTLAYTSPDMRYTLRNIREEGNRGVLLDVDFGARIHTAVSFENGLDFSTLDFSTLDVGSLLGLDFSIGAEYPLFSWIDVGLEITNIPLKRSTLRHYMEMRGSFTLDSSKINLDDIFGGSLPDDLFDFNLPDGFVYGESDISIWRPFKMVFYANFRPFASVPFTAIGKIGFAVNPLFVQKGSIEIAGMARYSLGNIIITTFGMGYENQMWKNSLDFIFNLHVFELNLGASMQSQQFAKSWQAAGLRVNLGLKFGF